MFSSCLIPVGPGQCLHKGRVRLLCMSQQAKHLIYLCNGKTEIGSLRNRYPMFGIDESKKGIPPFSPERDTGSIHVVDAKDNVSILLLVLLQVVPFPIAYLFCIISSKYYLLQFYMLSMLKTMSQFCFLACYRSCQSQ